jgi:hypothetical protein|nr:MAG TPA: hypothetical protein [Caudoviricetes sp.]
MKIIDLLVKISQGEKMPKKIKYEGYVWEYDKVAKDYYRNDIDEEYIYLFQDLFKKETGLFINNEVEIIEEDKKIIRLEFEEGNIEDKLFLARYITHNRAKINELIDEVNKLK